MLKRIASYFRRIKLPQEVKTHKGKILLHIGDVDWDRFPYICKMIRQIHPEILVHTGDLVDNLKVGRIPEDIPAYKRQAPKLIACMEKYAGEVYIVPGNNDLEDFLVQNVKKAKIVQPNTCMKLEGVDFLLSHRVLDIEGEAQIYLYGHGRTGDTHTFCEGEKVYANVIYGPTVVFLEEVRCIRLKE